MSATGTQIIPLLLLRVAGLSLAVPTTSVSAVERWREPVRVPMSRPHAMGYCFWRGRPVPVIDLAGFLGHHEPRPALMPIVETCGTFLAFPIARVESMPSLTLEDFVHSGIEDLAVPSRFVRAVGHADEGEALVLNLVAIHDSLFGQVPLRRFR